MCPDVKSANKAAKRMKLSKRSDAQFTEVLEMIHQARYNAIKNINTELVKLYWNIGKYISGKLLSAEWGDSIIKLCHQW